MKKSYLALIQLKNFAGPQNGEQKFAIVQHQEGWSVRFLKSLISRDHVVLSFYQSQRKYVENDLQLMSSRLHHTACCLSDMTQNLLEMQPWGATP